MRVEIKIEPYNAEWPKIFEDEAAKIKEVLQDNLVAIHHIGSTSVPGLSSKPRIDILVAVKNRLGTIDTLKQIGYEYRGEFNVPFHYMFRKRVRFEFNLHMYDENHADIEAQLLFRDYLRTHADDREQYTALKLKLLQDESSFYRESQSSFAEYTLGKYEFITNILNKAGFNNLKFTRCTYHKEWEMAKQLRQKYFFDKHAIRDPYTWTFNHKEHQHFILYKGTEIVGYAHIQLFTKSQALIRIIVITDEMRKHGFGKEFLQLIEKWLKEYGYSCIHAESTIEALPFYKKLGYINMPFPDTGEEDQRTTDIAVGKQL